MTFVRIQYVNCTHCTVCVATSAEVYSFVLVLPRLTIILLHVINSIPLFSICLLSCINETQEINYYYKLQYAKRRQWRFFVLIYKSKRVNALMDSWRSRALSFLSTIPRKLSSSAKQSTNESEISAQSERRRSNVENSPLKPGSSDWFVIRSRTREKFFIRYKLRRLV